MSQLAMPFLVVNLGCEMLYILEQRLKAQNIPGDKSCKVLQDVIRTMFDASYVDKLFTPQELYSVASTRKIFDRLAHSSIMRLSESSMDKLFDLMLMGVKYQLLCSTKLDQIVEVSALHLSTVKGMVQSLPEQSVVPLINNVEDLINKTYKSLSLGQLHLLRQTLLRFFQDKRVKVSLFLQEGIQSSMGRIILPAPVSTYVGTYTYYDLTGGLENQEKVKLKSTEVAATEFYVHPAPLGTNLYNKDRAKVVPPPRKGDLVAGPVKLEDDYKPSPEEYVEKSDGASRKELLLLSALLNLKPKATDNFKLNLFGEDDGGSASTSGKVAVSSGGSKVPTISFGSAGKNEAYKSGTSGLAKVIKTMSVDDKKPQKADEEDLLDLLDSAK